MCPAFCRQTNPIKKLFNSSGDISGEFFLINVKKIQKFFKKAETTTEKKFRKLLFSAIVEQISHQASKRATKNQNPRTLIDENGCQSRLKC